MRTNYINIDSSKRNKETQYIFDNTLHNLASHAFKFSDGSSIINIELPNCPFNNGDQVVFGNVTSKNVVLQNVLSIKKNSLFLRINHPDHGISYYNHYNPENPDDFIPVSYVDILPSNFNEDDDIPDGAYGYAIYKNSSRMGIHIVLSNIVGSNFTKSLMGNVPINYLNGTHLVYLLFTKDGNTFICDKNNYLIRLKKKSDINYRDGINFVKDKNGKTKELSSNTVCIKYCNLFGVSLDIINSTEPHIILNADSNGFSIDLKHSIARFKQIENFLLFAHAPHYAPYIAIVDPENNFYDTEQGGGSQSFVREVVNSIPGYPNPNSYEYNLDRTYTNIVQIRLIASQFPNSQKIINENNNKLYWKNLDHDHIYQLSVPPGNYSPHQLSTSINNEFSKIPYHNYTDETSKYSESSKYDEMGNNKFHIVEMDISNTMDTITFSSYKELVQYDEPNSCQIISVYDDLMIFYIPNLFQFFDPKKEILYIYFTPNTVDGNFPYAYFNLYRYEQHSKKMDTFFAYLDVELAILVNFHKNSIHELNSINTPTVLENFTYDFLTNEVTKPNHGLKIGDIIITDQFVDPSLSNDIFLYEIDKTFLNKNKFSVKKYQLGKKYKFVYNNMVLNYDNNSNISSTSTPTVTLHPKSHPSIKNFARIYHPNHQLSQNDTIYIFGSPSINGVPSDIINNKHRINRIIDDDFYEITLNNYLPVFTIPVNSRIVIKYPNMFRMYFDFPNTLGPMLNFPSIVTPFSYIISNENIIPKKLNMTGFNYFYICSPMLENIHNTSPVSNVFAIVRWFENPGSVVFDSFVPGVKILNQRTLTKFNFTMCNPDGSLVDFNGLDHSFVLEVVEAVEKIKN